jgi:hypothetical protein
MTLLKKRKVAAWRNNEGMWPMLAMDSKNRIYCVSQDLRIENRKLINKVWIG